MRIREVLRENYYALMAGVSLLVLTGLNKTGFSATTGTEDGDTLTSVIGQQAQDVGEASKAAISNAQWVIALVMLVLFFVFIIAGGVGSYFFYKKTRGNPQQPANETMALLWGLGGAVAGLVLWSVLAGIIYAKLGISIIDLFKQATAG